MARNVEEIFNDMAQEAKRLSNASGNSDIVSMFDNSSKAAVWKIIFYAIAFSHFVFETIMDKFIVYINDMISRLGPHNLRWYRTKALAFQFAFNLLPESDKFDNGNASPEIIENSKIIKYAAVNETTVEGKRVILIKIAGESAGDLTQLSSEQEAAFIAYMENVKDAGNKLLIYNRQADSLRAEIEVYYNPLILSADGNRLDGEGMPLPESANNYLRSLPFNGEFSVAAFGDALQSAYGVSQKNVFIKKIERRTGDGTWQSVATTFIPDAGYIRFADDGLIFNYTGHV
jgi:hypothetical protein